LTDVDPAIDSALLRRVADELEIRNVIARLAQLADTVPDEDLGDYMAMLTEDACWVVVADTVVPAQERRGQAEILAGVRERRAAGIQGPGTHQRHVVSTQVVEFESEDTAQSRCYCQTFQETDTSRPVPSLTVEYHDTLVRTAAGWKLRRRELIPG